MMQLLYGNDGTNYRVVARSKGMTEVQEKELLEGYLGYDFVKDPSGYSGAHKEPAAISYVTTNLSNALTQEKILLVKNARMTNYLTPSYYAHFQLIDMSKELYGNGFIDLLKYSFIEDVDLTKYVNKDIDSFQPVINDIKISTDAIEKNKLLPIVASVLDVADSVSKQVSIVLDAEGDAYNGRALEVIATIYKYLPYNVRKKVGFTTYARAEGSGSSRIKLKLYARDALDRLGRNVIDLKNMNGARILERLPKMVVDLARDFVGQDEGQREEWFQSFGIVFQLQNVSVEDHVSFYKNLRSWQKDDLEELGDRLAKYAAVEIAKKQESPVFQMFKNLINHRFIKEKYLQRYLEIIKNLLEKNDSFDFDSRLKSYIMLGEALKVVEFEPQSFLDWERKKIIQREKESYKDLELCGRLKAQYQAVRTMQCGGDKFRQIQMCMAEEMKNEAEEQINQVKKNIEEDKQNVITFLQGRKIREEDLKEVAVYFKQNIRYEDNKKVFRNTLFQEMSQELGSLEYFRSFGKYKRYIDILGRYKEYLTEEDYKSLANMAEQKGETVKLMEKFKTITWDDKSDILKSYQNMANMNAVSEGKQVTIPKYDLIIVKDAFQLSKGELEALTEFLLVPNYKNKQEFVRLIKRERNMLNSICKIGGYGGEHFRYLMELAGTDVKAQEQMLKYYLSNDILLSADQVDDGLLRVEADLLYNLGAEKSKTILGNVIQDRLGTQGEESSYDIKIFDDHRVVEERRERKTYVISFLGSIIPALAFAAISFLSLAMEFTWVKLSVISLVIFVAAAGCLQLKISFDESKWEEVWTGGAIGFGLSLLAVWGAFWMYVL